MVMTEVAGEVAGHSPSQKPIVRRDAEPESMLHVVLSLRSDSE